MGHVSKKCAALRYSIETESNSRQGKTYQDNKVRAKNFAAKSKQSIISISVQLDQS
ncbi:hypothetical protein CCACVL1_24524 [Corchorus capsularis]|uniref:Uncharacterized protein n=1 Tax=Corchorus capsularis TaxID=210143 RepID=A0A1R3GP99_COCAP|nr:hypothetical protein CCACVL1_24524 [Corchorus capsularis]